MFLISRSFIGIACDEGLSHIRDEAQIEYFSLLENILDQDRNQQKKSKAFFTLNWKGQMYISEYQCQNQELFKEFQNVCNFENDHLNIHQESFLGFSTVAAVAVCFFAFGLACIYKNRSKGYQNYSNIKDFYTKEFYKVQYNCLIKLHYITLATGVIICVSYLIFKFTSLAISHV